MEVTVENSWKGPLVTGEVLHLSLPREGYENYLRVNDGATIVAFAKLYTLRVGTTRFGSSDACMFPAGSDPSDKGLIKQLDEFKKHRN